MVGSIQRITVFQDLFMMAFERDVDYHDIASQQTYLDRSTGDVIWVYETDEDAYMETGIPADGNRQERERIAGNPNRYLEIPSLDQGDHHEILKAFLRSDWTDD